jgi:ribosomal protein S12 methylthiotransferase
MLGSLPFHQKKVHQPTSLPDQLPEAVKEARREALMLAQQPISWQRNQHGNGSPLWMCLIEQENPATGMCIGRSARFAPDVDGLVYVQGAAPLNQIVPVEITAADTYDLFGRVAVPALLS